MVHPWVKFHYHFYLRRNERTKICKLQIEDLERYLDSEEFVVANNFGLLGNVDTIEKLSDILVSDEGFVVNKSATVGDVFDIVTLEPELVLLFWGDTADDTWKHLYFSVDLLSEEISDFDSGSVFLNDHVDWEMRVDGSHLVSETGGDTDGHVRDVGCNGSKGSLLPHGSPPLGDSHGLSSGLFELDFQVAEVSFEGTSWAADGDSLAFDDHLDGFAVFGKINIVVAVYGLHGLNVQVCF